MSFRSVIISLMGLMMPLLFYWGYTFLFGVSFSFCFLKIYNNNLVNYELEESPKTRQDAFEYASKEGAVIWVKYSE